MIRCQGQENQRPGEPYPTTVARAWSAISGPQGEPYLQPAALRAGYDDGNNR